ncbi:hypothetical protein ACFYSW_12240 [Rhodococcus aetherivorans]|uniref:hypothetical protein n=1 Tax=Rhodococcus aetherivorans TaxID=191292 RepID=UPI0036BA553B
MLYEKQSLDKIRMGAADTGVRTVVCVDSYADGTVGLDDLESRDVPDFDFDRVWRSVSRDGLLALIFPSRTTGAPQGVKLTHGDILFSVATNVAIQAECARADAQA